jgi:hypothetical protein
MIPPGSLRLVDDDDLANPSEDAIASEPKASSPDPKVFVRTILTPSGFPWEQSQAADLEARNGSPLPIAEVAYRLKRLEAWRPGAPGRYAAFYVLAKEIDGQFDASAQVDGRSVGVSFAGAHEDIRRAKVLGAVGLGVALIAFGLVVSVGLALTRRAEMTTALEIAEQKASVKFKAARIKQRILAQDRDLAAWPDKGAKLDEVMAEIAWVSAMRDPNVRIDAFHWDRGYIGVEARGATPPVSVSGSRVLERSAKPIRSGVWLWGLPPSVAGSNLSGPVAAVPRAETAR